jgi:hypothetical protein
MSFEHVITQSIGGSAGPISKRISITSGSQIAIDESFTHPITNGEIALVIDVSQLKSLYIVVDKAANLFFNEASTGTPSKTLNLVANQPFVWTNLSLHTNPFGATDVTKVFITTTVAGATRLQIFGLLDPTV